MVHPGHITCKNAIQKNCHLHLENIEKDADISPVITASVVQSKDRPPARWKFLKKLHQL